MKICKAIGCSIEFTYSDTHDYCPKCRGESAANDPVQPAPTPTPSAMDFMRNGIGHMEERALQHDSPEGERSVAKTVAMFNVLEGTSLTETQGWRFMALLKMVRSTQGDFNPDDYEDGASYAALTGESHAREVALES